MVREGPVYSIKAHVRENGRCEAREFLDGLQEKERVKFERYFLRTCLKGRIANTEIFRYEGDGIWRFRSGRQRLLCFFTEDDEIILTHGYQKQKQRAPKKELDKAKRISREYNIKTNF